MNRKSKIILIIATVLSVLYSVLSGFGFAGTQTDTGGFVYRLIIIAALIFACSLVFSGAFRQGGKFTTGERGNEAFIAGLLGLSLLLVFEVYTFFYIHI